MYDHFKRGTKTYFIYNDKHYYTDESLKGVLKYYKFEVSANDYAKAYRSK